MLAVCADIKTPNKYNCIELARQCPTEADAVDCARWKTIAKSRQIRRKVVKSKKRIRANLQKTAAKNTYKRVFCALVLKMFKADVCKIVFERLVSGANAGRRLEEAEWDVTHEFSSSTDTVSETAQESIQRETFDSALVSDLAQADAASFASTTVEDKGAVVESETVTIYEVSCHFEWSLAYVH